MTNPLPNIQAPHAPEPGDLVGLGWIPSKDPRDRQYQLRREVPVKTFRSWIAPGPVLDQGATSMCVAYSGGKYLMTHPVTNALPNLPDLYKECQRNDEWEGEDYDGTSVRALMKVFKNRGFVSEYRWAFDVQTLTGALINHGPVVMGTSWYMDMFVPDDNGYITPTGQNAGGLAYLLVAANTQRRNPDGSKGAVRILNSWGPGWGQGGRAWLTLQNLEKLLKDWGEAAMATELRVR
jgi:C1A family cysteine protease